MKKVQFLAILVCITSCVSDLNDIELRKLVEKKDKTTKDSFQISSSASSLSIHKENVKEINNVFYYDSLAYTFGVDDIQRIRGLTNLIIDYKSISDYKSVNRLIKELEIINDSNNIKDNFQIYFDAQMLIIENKILFGADDKNILNGLNNLKVICIQKNQKDYKNIAELYAMYSIYYVNKADWGNYYNAAKLSEENGKIWLLQGRGVYKDSVLYSSYIADFIDAHVYTNRQSPALLDKIDEGINIALRTSNKKEYSRFLLQKANLYESINLTDSAAFYYQTALEKLKTNKSNPEDHVLVLANYIRFILAQNQMETFEEKVKLLKHYAKMSGVSTYLVWANDFEQIMKLLVYNDKESLDKCIQILENTINSPNMKSTILGGVADYYNSKHQPAIALRIVNSSIIKNPNLLKSSEASGIYQTLAILNKQVGNYKLASMYQDSLRVIELNRLQQSNAKLLEFYKLRLQVERQKNRVDNLEAKNSHKKLMLGFGVVILIFLAGFLLYFIKEKKKLKENNLILIDKQLEIEQKNTDLKNSQSMLRELLESKNSENTELREKITSYLNSIEIVNIKDLNVEPAKIVAVQSGRPNNIVIFFMDDSNSILEHEVRFTLKEFLSLNSEKNPNLFEQTNKSTILSHNYFCIEKNQTKNTSKLPTSFDKQIEKINLTNFTNSKNKANSEI